MLYMAKTLISHYVVARIHVQLDQCDQINVNIHQYLLQDMYPSTFSKSDKQALRKMAKFFTVKGADLYYMCRGENRNHVLQSQACNIRLLLILCIQQVDDGCQNAARLFVENIDQRQRIVSLTHDDGPFGVNRTNSITSK